IVEVMRYAGCYLTDGIQSLYLPQIPACTFFGRHVGDGGPTADKAAVGPELASRRQTPIEDAAAAGDEAVVDSADDALAPQHLRPGLVAIKLDRLRRHEFGGRALLRACSPTFRVRCR